MESQGRRNESVRKKKREGPGGLVSGICGGGFAFRDHGPQLGCGPSPGFPQTAVPTKQETKTSVSSESSGHGKKGQSPQSALPPIPGGPFASTSRPAGAQPEISATPYRCPESKPTARNSYRHSDRKTRKDSTQSPSGTLKEVAPVKSSARGRIWISSGSPVKFRTRKSWRAPSAADMAGKKSSIARSQRITAGRRAPRPRRPRPFGNRGSNPPPPRCPLKSGSARRRSRPGAVPPPSAPRGK